MLQKHRQILILIVGLLYIYSVCPLLCATFEQKFCHDTSQKVLSGDTHTRAICCQAPKTGTTDEAESPSENGKPCCSTDLELVFPDDRHNVHESRELINQSLVSVLPIATVLPVFPRESFQVFAVPLTAAFFPDNSLSRRGPPFLQC